MTRTANETSRDSSKKKISSLRCTNKCEGSENKEIHHELDANTSIGHCNWINIKNPNSQQTERVSFHCQGKFIAESRRDLFRWWFLSSDLWCKFLFRKGDATFDTFFSARDHKKPGGDFKRKICLKNPQESPQKSKTPNNTSSLFHFFRFCRFLMSIGYDNGPEWVRTGSFYSEVGAAFLRQIDKSFQK